MPPNAGRPRGGRAASSLASSPLRWPRHLGCPATSTSNATGANNRSIGQKCFRCELLSTARGPPAVRSGLVKCSAKCSSLDRSGHHASEGHLHRMTRLGRQPSQLQRRAGLRFKLYDLRHSYASELSNGSQACGRGPPDGTQERDDDHGVLRASIPRDMGYAADKLTQSLNPDYLAI